MQGYDSQYQTFFYYLTLYLDIGCNSNIYNQHNGNGNIQNDRKSVTQLSQCI